jgi:hypothetical protein
MSAARSGAGWSEVHVNLDTGTSVATSFENGDSLLLLHDLMSGDELASLNAEVARAISYEREAQARFTRFGPQPVADAQADMFQQHRVRIPLARMPASASKLCDKLLVRVLTLLETQIPDLTADLFGKSLPCTTCIGNPSFEHSRGEPAINVYTASGCLNAHEDQHYVTVLIPLSDGRAADGEDVRAHAAPNQQHGNSTFTGVSRAGPNQPKPFRPGLHVMPSLCQTHTHSSLSLSPLLCSHPHVTMAGWHGVLVCGGSWAPVHTECVRLEGPADSPRSGDRAQRRARPRRWRTRRGRWAVVGRG